MKLSARTYEDDAAYDADIERVVEFEATEKRTRRGTRWCFHNIRWADTGERLPRRLISKNYYTFELTAELAKENNGTGGGEMSKPDIGIALNACRTGIAGLERELRITSLEYTRRILNRVNKLHQDIDELHAAIVEQERENALDTEADRDEARQDTRELKDAEEAAAREG